MLKILGKTGDVQKNQQNYLGMRNIFEHNSLGEVVKKGEPYCEYSHP